MDSITLGNIAIAVSFLVALITGTGTLIGFFKKWIVKAMSEQLQAYDQRFIELNKRMDTLAQRIDEVDMSASKDYLVTMICRLKSGEKLDEIEKKRFIEEYHYYTENLHGNSYIKYEVENLKKEGII